MEIEVKKTVYDELLNSLKNCVYIPCGDAQKEKCLVGKEDDCRRELMAIAANALEELSKDRDKWEVTAKEERAAYWHWFDNYQKDVPRWISVKDKLPQVAEWVLAMSDDYILPVEVFRDDSCWMDVLMHEVSVTHWMPLPQPPKEE